MATTEQEVAGFSQGRSLRAGCDGGVQRHGPSGIAMSILERTVLGSQVIKREVQKERGERSGQGRVKSAWRP